MEDEDFVLSVKDWAKKTGKRKYFGQYMPIRNINTRLNITSYAFAQFVSKYLLTHRLKLAYHEIEIQEQLEEAILCGSITRSDRIIDCQTEICSKTARKWLNRLGYKWKKVQKGVFYYGHERKDDVEERENFFEKIKKLLPYFMKFGENGLILSKKYPKDCIVGPNQWSIILITDDKSTFLANNRR